MDMNAADKIGRQEKKPGPINIALEDLAKACACLEEEIEATEVSLRLVLASNSTDADGRTNKGEGSDTGRYSPVAMQIMQYADRVAMAARNLRELRNRVDL